MRLKNILIIAIDLLFASPIYAKQKEKIPDFSGHWESAADFCSFQSYHSYKLKQKKDTVTGYFESSESLGQGADWGRVKGKIRHGKLFIQICSMRGADDIFSCSKYSPTFNFLVKKGTILLKYDNKKYLSKVEGYEEEPYMLYKNFKNEKKFIPPVQKMRCVG